MNIPWRLFVVPNDVFQPRRHFSIRLYQTRIYKLWSATSSVSWIMCLLCRYSLLLLLIPMGRQATKNKSKPKCKTLISVNKYIFLAPPDHRLASFQRFLGGAFLLIMQWATSTEAVLWHARHATTRRHRLLWFVSWTKHDTFKHVSIYQEICTLLSFFIYI